MINSQSQVIAEQLTVRRSRQYKIWHEGRRFVRSEPIGSLCLIVLCIMIVSAVFASYIAPYSPTKNDVGPALVGPSIHNWLGTDQFGRDVFSRAMFGARISIYVGIISTVGGVILATIMATISGYFGGIVDYGVQRIVDAVQAVPPIILLVGIIVVLGPSVTNVVLALMFRMAFSSSRVVRGAVIGIRETSYIESARASGAGNFRIIGRHIIPNVFPIVVVLVSTSIGGMVIAEASLSFLGYGIPPPAPTWGGMLSAEGRTYMIIAPWLLVVPAVAISAFVFCVNMFGDSLRDTLDPRLRGQR